MALKRLVGTVVAASALAGCATAGDEASPATPPVPPPSATGSADCFHPREVQSFDVLDRSNLIVYATGESRAYHVRISPPSVDLRNTERLAFIGSSGRICGYAGERLVVDRRHSGPPLSIIAVSRLSPEGLESLRPSTGKDAAAIPGPQPGDGPDIEDIGDPSVPGTVPGADDGSTPD